jgi:hypothetical protein
MRPGFTEDGFDLLISLGSYSLMIHETAEDALYGFTLLKEGAVPDREFEVGRLYIDGSCIGVFDKVRFMTHFNGDFESIYEWSASKTFSTESWQDISHEKAGLAFYVRISSDCECILSKLYVSDEIVGLKVEPIYSSKTRDEQKSLTWISFTCNGIDQEFNICHDRDYEIELEDVIDDVLAELCTVESEDGLEFIDESSIQIDRPVAVFRHTYSGLNSVEVIYEELKSGVLKRFVIDPDIQDQIAKVDEQTSTKELARCMFEIFKKSQNLVK